MTFPPSMHNSTNTPDSDHAIDRDFVATDNVVDSQRCQQGDREGCEAILGSLPRRYAQRKSALESAHASLIG